MTTRTCSCCSREIKSKRALSHPECKQFMSFMTAAEKCLDQMVWSEEAVYRDGDSKKLVSGQCLRRVRGLWTRSCNTMTKGYVSTDTHTRTASDKKRCPQCGRNHTGSGKSCVDCQTWQSECKARKVCTVCNCSLVKPKRGPMPTACKGCRDFQNFLTGAVKQAAKIRFAGGHVVLKQTKTNDVVKRNVRNLKAKQHMSSMWGVLNYQLRPSTVWKSARRTNAPNKPHP